MQKKGDKNMLNGTCVSFLLAIINENGAWEILTSTGAIRIPELVG